MRRCFSSLGCPELSLEDTLRLAREHAVPCVELRALGGTVDLAAHLAATGCSPATLAAQVRAAAVDVVAFDASLRLVGGTEEERRQLLSLGPWAEALGVRWLRVFDGGRAADAGEFAAAADTLQWWRAERAQRRWQVDVMVETHDSLLTSAALARFVAAFPGTRILWDAHHTWRKGGEDPTVTWPVLRPHVVHVHVKDSIDVPSARHPFTYVLPGDGGFPAAAVRELLEAGGYRGAVSLEWEKLWHPYLPPLDTALSVANDRGWW